MTTIAMVGGTSGLGYSACLALANDPKVSKVVLTSRSAASAERAINSLSASSKKPKGEFESVLLDLEDLGSIQAAVASFPPFDVICLSAGGLAKTGKSAHQHTESGVTHSVLINALGIATLVDGLLKTGKIKAGSRVVLIGSEASRVLCSLMGFLPMTKTCCLKKHDIDDFVTRDYKGCWGCCPVRSVVGSYRNAKIVSQAHFSQLAKDHSEVHWLTISPGSVGGGFLAKTGFPAKQIAAWCPCTYRCICSSHACTNKENVRIGTAHYMRYLVDSSVAETYSSGAMMMAGKSPCACCYYAATGSHFDNRPRFSHFKNEAIHEAAAAAMRRHQRLWEMNLGIDKPREEKMADSPAKVTPREKSAFQ